MQEWDEWGICSSSCGTGVRQRERECHPPLHGGKLCPLSLVDNELCEQDNDDCTEGIGYI